MSVPNFVGQDDPCVKIYAVFIEKYRMPTITEEFKLLHLGFLPVLTLSTGSEIEQREKVNFLVENVLLKQKINYLTGSEVEIISLKPYIAWTCPAPFLHCVSESPFDYRLTGEVSEISPADCKVYRFDHTDPDDLYKASAYYPLIDADVLYYPSIYYLILKKPEGFIFSDRKLIGKDKEDIGDGTVYSQVLQLVNYFDLLPINN